MKVKKLSVIPPVRLDISAGREEFLKLSQTKRAGKIGIEKFVQSPIGRRYNLKSEETAVGSYVKYYVLISNACKSAIEKFKHK